MLVGDLASECLCTEDVLTWRCISRGAGGVMRTSRTIPAA
jgi:hypothetical protein